MTFIKIDPEPWEPEGEWFWVKWLRRKGFLDEEADSYSKQGWVSKKWGLFMWKYIIPVLVKLHKLKWQAVYDAQDEDDEIEWEYKYLRDCSDENGWVVRKISDIDPEDFEYFRAVYNKEKEYELRTPHVREITEDTITLSSPGAYQCLSCGWEPWDPDSFFKAWNCRRSNISTYSSMDFMGTCTDWDEAWFCTRCWNIYSYNTGTC